MEEYGDPANQVVVLKTVPRTWPTHTAKDDGSQPLHSPVQLPLATIRDRRYCPAAPGGLSLPASSLCLRFQFHSNFCGTDACGALRAGLTWRPSCLLTTGAIAARGAKRSWALLPVPSIASSLRLVCWTPSGMPANCWHAGPRKTCSSQPPHRRHCPSRAPLEQKPPRSRLVPGIAWMPLIR